MSYESLASRLLLCPVFMSGAQRGVRLGCGAGRVFPCESVTSSEGYASTTRSAVADRRARESWGGDCNSCDREDAVFRSAASGATQTSIGSETQADCQKDTTACRDCFSRSGGAVAASRLTSFASG